jgi:hypothetical protein
MIWWAGTERIWDNWRFKHPMAPAIEDTQDLDFETQYCIHEQIMAIIEGWA